MRPFILLFSLLLLAGCGHLQQLQVLNPEANDFSSSLSAEYLAYASAEAEQGHALNADYFAGKGLQAWRGDPVELEPVDATLPKPAQAKLNYARNMLSALLTDDVKHVAAQKAARAQLLFDCSVKQAALKTKPTTVCSEELQQALLDIETVASSFMLGKETMHEIRFSAGSASLSKAALALVDEITGYVQDETAFAIDLEGRADNAAGKQLFEKRASALRKAFAARGIMEDHIQMQSTGSANGKAVYLSCDDTVKDKNKIRVTIRVFGQDKKETGAQTS